MFIKTITCKTVLCIVCLDLKTRCTVRGNTTDDGCPTHCDTTEMANNQTSAGVLQLSLSRRPLSEGKLKIKRSEMGMGWGLMMKGMYFGYCVSSYKLLLYEVA